MHKQESMLSMLISTYVTDRSEVKRKLVFSKKYLLGCAVVYRVYAKNNCLHTLDDRDYIEHDSCNIKDKSDFEYLYTRFRDEETTRPYYKGIIEDKLCTYCIYKDAEQVDHYLPQAIYSSYSLTLDNLIPICGTCNNTKRTKVPLSEEWFFHPYFDYTGQYFLNVEIEFNAIPVIKYSVPENRFSLKLDYTFKTLNLYDKFSSLANNELLDVLDMFHELGKIDDNSANAYLRKRMLQANREGVLWKKSLYREICKNIDFLLRGYIEYYQKISPHCLS